MAQSSRSRLPAEQRRREIIDAAASLFRLRRYDEVSLDEIASIAGVTRPLITHHFGTKHALYLEVVRRVLDVGTVPVPAYVHGMSLRERLESSVDKWLENNDSNRELWLDSIRMQGLGDPEISSVVEQAREHVAQQAAAVAGIPGADSLSDRQMAALRIWAGIAEAATLQYLGYGRLTHDETRQVMLESLELIVERLLAEPNA